MAEKVFVPHAECGAADGRCFEEGRCLMKCQPRLPARDANAQLSAAVRLLGIFVRLSQRDGKHAYLQDLPLVLHYLVQECRAQPELSAFDNWLSDRVVPLFVVSMPTSQAMFEGL